MNLLQYTTFSRNIKRNHEKKSLFIHFSLFFELIAPRNFFYIFLLFFEKIYVFCRSMLEKMALFESFFQFFSII